jgi:hypothetical protein
MDNIITTCSIEFMRCLEHDNDKKIHDNEKCIQIYRKCIKSIEIFKK